jgi:hypothetical protein
MRLRSLTQHIRNQNWFAVALDFCIVVIGVGAALMGQQWISAGQQRADMRVAEAALQIDLWTNYSNAQERLSHADCRKAEYQAIAAQLLEPGETWTPVTRPPYANAGGPALSGVFRSPQRFWGSRTWDAGLARGTFNRMADERRDTLDGLFLLTQYVEDIQFEVYTLEGRMKMLAVVTTISPDERPRYYEILGELDGKSTAIEGISRQIIAAIEVLGINVPASLRTDVLEDLSASNARRAALYGDCFVPMAFPILDASVSDGNAP